jgi:hypothetical protein
MQAEYNQLSFVFLEVGKLSQIWNTGQEILSYSQEIQYIEYIKTLYHIIYIIALPCKSGRICIRSKGND